MRCITTTSYDDQFARIGVIDLDELKAKADADLKPFLDAAGEDLTAISFEADQDEIGMFEGCLCWMATVVPTFATRPAFPNAQMEVRLHLGADGIEVASIGCEPHMVRLMISDLTPVA